MAISLVSESSGLIGYGLCQCCHLANKNTKKYLWYSLIVQHCCARNRCKQYIPKIK